MLYNDIASVQRRLDELNAQIEAGGDELTLCEEVELLEGAMLELVPETDADRRALLALALRRLESVGTDEAGRLYIADATAALELAAA